jgi:uncharacterized protein (DUF2252 family)
VKFAASNDAYERWLAEQLGDALVPKDLRKKRKKMKEGAFPFLRATYWRWAEIVLEACPELAGAPQALAVGDIHLENYGTWRDAEGRLVWGINDYDEATRMPVVLDVVRLATSAILARRRGHITAHHICAEIFTGYRDGLKHPAPFVLDDAHKWLRKLVVVPEKARSLFRQKLKLKPARNPPQRFLDALETTVPEPRLAMEISRRVAGVGSLGRLRLVGIGQWRDAPLVREAKAITVSAWSRASGERSPRIRLAQIANGRHRSPDPWFQLHGDVLVRRLSPNNRKIEVEDHLPMLLGTDMLRAMGFDLAAAHLGASAIGPAIAADLKQRPKGWLETAARRMAALIADEQRRFKRD